MKNVLHSIIFIIFALFLGYKILLSPIETQIGVIKSFKPFVPTTLDPVKIFNLINCQ